MEPRISFVTLGVADLPRATAFYAGVLRLPQRKSPAGVAFFEMGRTWLALFPSGDLAADAGVSSDGSGFPRFALAHNTRSPAEVDGVLAEFDGGEIAFISETRAYTLQADLDVVVVWDPTTMEITGTIPMQPRRAQSPRSPTATAFASATRG